MLDAKTVSPERRLHGASNTEQLWSRPCIDPLHQSQYHTTSTPNTYDSHLTLTGSQLESFGHHHPYTSVPQLFVEPLPFILYDGKVSSVDSASHNYPICPTPANRMPSIHSLGVAHRYLKPENILLTSDKLPRTVGTRAVTSASDKRRDRNCEAKFICTICSHDFTAKHNLEYHIRAHNDERPFKCDVCPTAMFRAKSDLTRHRKSKVHLVQSFMASLSQSPFATLPRLTM